MGSTVIGSPRRPSVIRVRLTPPPGVCGFTATRFVTESCVAAYFSPKPDYIFFTKFFNVLFFKTEEILIMIKRFTTRIYSSLVM